MLIDVPIESLSEKRIKSYLNKPSQSLGLIGSGYLGIDKIIDFVASSLLGISSDRLINYPYITRINSVDNKAIGIEVIRQLSSFLSLKVPKNNDPNRIVIINSADKMTIEAQNALLKSLEEPPKKTIFILSASEVVKLLPTVISRLETININKPSSDQLFKYYSRKGHQESEIKQVYLISDGMPGLMTILLEEEQHPLNIATNEARELLSSTTFDRLNKVNDLAKSRQSFIDLVFIIKQMSKLGLLSTDYITSNRWRKIFESCLEAEQKLASNAQTKLTITNFVMSIA
jgi:DNA polymerase III delta prime subunit